MGVMVKPSVGVDNIKEQQNPTPYINERTGKNNEH